MKVLFLNAYFYPENIAFSHLEQDIMEGLIRAGHELCVICPTPTRGVSREVTEKYRKIKYETLNGVEVCRFRAPCEGKNPLIRAFRYFWCHFRGDMIARRRKDIDAIFAVSTPPTQGYFASKVAKKLRVPLIYSLQDVFPDSLATTGLTREGSLLYRIGESIAKKTYDRCRSIVVLSGSVRENLQQKGVPQEKLVTIGNWIDTDAVQPVSREDNRLFEEYGIDREKFTVVYAGNFGASQGADVILEAAALLKDREDIDFVIYGGGTGYEKAQESVVKNALTNVTVNPLLPPDRVSEVYSLGDAALITCKKGVSKTAMPSKLWSIMACNTPIIASFDTDSELAGILRQAGAGICTEPENARALADAIADAANNRPSSTARDYVIAHASKQSCVKQYRECLEAAII